MSWLLLIIVGVVLLIVGYMAPLPPPLPVILQIIGWICLAVGVILLVVGLLQGAGTLDLAALAPLLL